MSDFYAGLISGIVSTFVCNPFDVIRTNLQLNNKISYNLSFLYRGIIPSLITIPSYWSCYFYSYNKLKENNPIEYTKFANGYIASNISSTITCPLWVIRQKYQITSNNSITSHLSSVQSPFFNLSKFIKQNGIFSLYNGLLTTYFINASFIIQMPVYEKLKQSQQFINMFENDTIRIFMITSIAKTLAACVFYPLDTIRTIRRNPSNYINPRNPSNSNNSSNSLLSIIKTLNKTPIKYYSGLSVYLIRSIPYHSTTFCVYEYIKSNQK